MLSEKRWGQREPLRTPCIALDLAHLRSSASLADRLQYAAAVALYAIAHWGMVRTVYRPPVRTALHPLRIAGASPSACLAHTIRDAAAADFYFTVYWRELCRAPVQTADDKSKMTTVVCTRFAIPRLCLDP